MTDRLKGHSAAHSTELLISMNGGGYVGRASCECGAKSPRLYSDEQRKQWHRAHKAEVRRLAGLDAVAAEQSIAERTGQWTQPLKHEL